MIFDRGFAVGYVLPVAAYLIVTLGVMHGFDIFPNVFPLTEARLLLGILIISMASWVGGVCLLIMNTDLVRFMEGYGKFNPARLFLGVQKQRYERLRKEIFELDKRYREYISNGEEFPPELQKKRSDLMLRQVRQFPDHESWILPTAFGNIIRAFEVYPRVMYGLESIQGWPRILAVIPKEYRELVDTAKAQTDLWVNLWFLSLLIIAEYIGFSIFTHTLRLPFLPLGAFMVAWIASHWAGKAADEWGEWVKASFDVFLPELRTKLGISPPETLEQEQEFWIGFSQAIVYRFPSSLTTVRDKWHPKEDNESSVP